MPGRESEKLEFSKNGMPLQRDGLHRGLGLLRVFIILIWLNFVVWIGFTTLFLASPINTGAWSLIWGVASFYSVFDLLTVILLSLAIRRCIQSSGISPRTISALLIRIVLLIWLFWAIINLFQGLISFFGVFPLLRNAFERINELNIFFGYDRRIVGFLFVLGNIALARKANARFGNRLVGVREFWLVAACGMLMWLVWLVHTEVVSLFLRNLMGGNNFGMFWTTKIGSLLLRGFGAFWIWRALGCAQKRLKAEIICPTCNYDLTGNTSGTCPECGKTISDATHTGPDPSPVSPAGAS